MLGVFSLSLTGCHGIFRRRFNESVQLNLIIPPLKAIIGKNGGSYMKTRNTVRVIAFCAAAVVVSAVFAVRTNNNLNRYRLEIKNNYAATLDTLNSGVNNISLILE